LGFEGVCLKVVKSEEMKLKEEDEEEEEEEEEEGRLKGWKKDER